MERKRPSLVLLQGGCSNRPPEPGPVTRLDLWSRVQPIRLPHLWMMVGAKLLVLGSLIYAFRVLR